jgi:hypothetical protein
MVRSGKTHVFRHRDTRRFPPEVPPDPKSRSPDDAVAARGASENDRLGRQVFWEASSKPLFAQATICVELIGSNCCEAEGVIARGRAPVLELCRELLAAGFSPGRRLEAWRGDTRYIRVRSIGEGAHRTVADDRHGTPRLRRRQGRPPGYVGASPVAQIPKGIAAPARQASWGAAP